MSIQLIDAESYRRSLAVRDLTDAALGPHAMQLLVRDAIARTRRPVRRWYRPHLGIDMHNALILERLARLRYQELLEEAEAYRHAAPAVEAVRLSRNVLGQMVAVLLSPNMRTTPFRLYYELLVARGMPST